MTTELTERRKALAHYLKHGMTEHASAEQQRIDTLETRKIKESELLARQAAYMPSEDEIAAEIESHSSKLYARAAEARKTKEDSKEKYDAAVAACQKSAAWKKLNADQGDAYDQHPLTIAMDAAYRVFLAAHNELGGAAIDLEAEMYDTGESSLIMSGDSTANREAAIRRLKTKVK